MKMLRYINNLRHDTCWGNIEVKIFLLKSPFFVNILTIHRHFHDISAGTSIYRCHVIPISFFFPKTLILGPGTGPTHSLRPAQHALHACEPSTTPMLKYNFLVSWIVDVGLQELEFLQGKEKSKRNATIGIWTPNLTLTTPHQHQPTNHVSLD